MYVAGELYGESDPNTFEWSDGLIASTVRRFARELSTEQKVTEMKATPAVKPQGTRTQPEVRSPRNPTAATYLKLIDSLPVSSIVP